MKTAMKRLAGLAAIATLATPTFAQAAANPASSLSLNSGVRASADAAKGKSNIGKATLINMGIFAVIIAAVLVATTTGGDDSPDSP